MRALILILLTAMPAVAGDKCVNRCQGRGASCLGRCQDGNARCFERCARDTNACWFGCGTLGTSVTCRDARGRDRECDPGRIRE